jgi:MFS transporter, DHA1 family, tetracycline resistance protein
LRGGGQIARRSPLLGDARMPPIRYPQDISAARGAAQHPRGGAVQTSITASSDPAIKRRALVAIFVVMLMDIIGLTIIIPVAPFLVQRFSDQAIMVTALAGTYAAFQFLAAPALGKISDRHGRRPVLLASILGSAIGYAIFGVGGALWVLFMARAIDGISGGNLSTASAFIADISTPEERPRNFALIGMAFGIGFILGPAIGGAVSAISLDAPAWTACILTLISLALVFFLLPESLPPERRERAALRPRDFNPLATIGDIARKPGVAILMVITCLFAFSFDGTNSSLALFVAERFGTQPWEIGALFVASGVVTAVMQAAVVPRVVGRFGEKRMVIVSQLGLALGTLVIAVAPAFWWLYPNVLLVSGVGGFIWSTLGALAAGQVQPHEQGQLAGASTALQSLMAVVGPLAAGLAYDQIQPSAPFLIGAGLFLLAGVVAAGIRSRAQAGAAAVAS